MDMKTAADNTNTQLFSNLLLERGITPTQQRLEIASFLFKKQQHVSADQILSNINQGQNPVSKATVYNTLGLFASKGLLREVIIDPSKVFYDTNTEHHHHFYNTNTCDLTDINHDEIHIDKLPGLPAGTNIQSVDVIIKVSNK
jgi:Fur family iron response transcriptional regulator|tara:strand:+ start:14975 stop:15403 length:429 start_codon:yes stop_codon:yes gene_type:complete